MKIDPELEWILFAGSLGLLILSFAAWVVGQIFASCS